VEINPSVNDELMEIYTGMEEIKSHFLKQPSHGVLGRAPTTTLDSFHS
jgi:hypothetical protein